MDVSRIRYEELIDITKLQTLLDSFHQAIGIANAVIDIDGVVLAKAGWQDVCTQFHRVNPQTCRRCIESDTALVEGMTRGVPYAVYNCLNGLIDAAAPIMVGGQHVANVFTGQFLTAAPDRVFFARQAREFGFDEENYLAAIACVPVVPQERVEAVTRLYAQLAGMLADSGFDRLKQQKATEQLEKERDLLEQRVQARTADLQRSEERLRMALDAAQLGWFDANVQTGSAHVGDEYPRMLGFTPEEFISSIPTWLASIHPDDAPQIKERFAQLLQSGGPESMEYRRRNKAGEWQWLQSTGEVVEWDADGKALRLAGTHQDITERKKAEEQLRRSEKRIRNMSDAAGAYLWEIDVNMVYAYVSSQSLQVKGYPPEALLGHTPMEFMPEADITPVGAIVNRAIADKSSFRLQHRDITPSGDVWWEEVYGAVFCNAEGKVIGLRGTGMNINARKQAELALRESENAFRKVLQASTDAVLLQDSTAAFVDCNQAALDLLGMTREQFIHMTPDQISVEFQPNGRRSEEYAPEMTALGWQGFHRFDWTCRNIDGGEFIVEVSLVPITLKGQRMLHCTWRNITERKRMEEQVRQMAFHDALTGLPNRRLFEDRLDQAVAAGRRSGRFGAVLFIDLDNFKPLNDTYGHAIGDLLLVEVAMRLKNAVREMDTVARLGGDEFVVIASELDEDKTASTEQARVLAEKIRMILLAPYRLAGHREGDAACIIEHRCSATVGVVVFSNHQVNKGGILKHADTAMYAAKAAGRNQVRVHDGQD